MISVKNKFLFIHIPKTAGNSIQSVLKRYSEDNIVRLTKFQDGIDRFEIRNNHFDVTKHSTLAEYEKAIKPKLFNQLYKFTVIRNPWDRMISFYFSPHRRTEIWDESEFRALVDRVKTASEYLTLDYGFPGNNHLRWQGIDYVLKFENIDDDFHTLCQLLNIKSVRLPKKNQSIRKHYSYYYNPELIELIKQKFSDEIEIGNYEFEGA